MSTSWLSADVLCPFYINDNGVYLNCENVLSHTKSVGHRFESSAEKVRYMKRCCCANYKKCIYYRLNEHKYNAKE